MPQEKNTQKTASAMEAILFIFGEAVDKKKLAGTLKVEESEIEQAAELISQKLSDDSSGIVLMDSGGKYMLATKPQHAALLEKFITEDLKEDLTPAALETLSIVAYFGPAVRAQIDYLRGVNSSFILRSLLIRGLLNRKTKGNAYEYEVSFDFLKYMGVDNVSRLPQYQEHQKLKEQFFAPRESQQGESPIMIEPSAPVGQEAAQNQQI
jgi:segregation and condensation protein B